MTDNQKSTFARRVRAAKRYDIRDDAIPGLYAFRSRPALFGPARTGR